MQNDYVPIAIHSSHCVTLPVSAELHRCEVVHRHCYLSAVHVDRRMPLFVAYNVELRNLLSNTVLSRNFHRDLKYCLKPSDYRGSGFDMGHACPLASCRAHFMAGDTNDMANIWPQFPDCNRGPWLKTENFVRKMAMNEGNCHVVAAALWESDCGEIGGVALPSHFAKVAVIGQKTCGWIIPQDCKRDDPIDTFNESLDEIIKRTGIHPWIH